jgi:Flp pilus assembly protein TadG
MVEFALIGPLAFLILLGIVVVAVVLLHEIQLTQGVRNSARAGALCGSATRSTTQTATLSDGTPCTGANLLSYINGQVTAVDSGLSNQASVTVYCNGTVSGCANGVTPSGGTGTGTASSVATATATCLNGYTVEVSITYYQPLYVPLVGNVLGSGGGPSNTRKIVATGEATCEGH